MVAVMPKLDKAFGVLVTIGGKQVLKEFDYDYEVSEFTEKLSQHQEVEFEVLERITRGIAGRPYSIAFVSIPTLNVTGGVWYKCIEVRPLKGHLFCTECHDYKKFSKKKDEYDVDYNCCPDCSIPDTDYYIKTANKLWPKE